MGDNHGKIDSQRFRKYEQIFQEGAPGGCMYVVQQGSVGIYSAYGTKEEKLLTTLEPGRFFGEMGMVRGLPRSASAVALENGTVVSAIGWDTLSQYFRETPAKVVGIMQQMSERIAELSDDYLEACGAVTELKEERDSLRRMNAFLARENDALRKREPQRGASADDTSDAGAEAAYPYPPETGAARRSDGASAAGRTLYFGDRKQGMERNEGKYNKFLTAYLLRTRSSD